MVVVGGGIGAEGSENKREGENPSRHLWMDGAPFLGIGEI